MEIKEYNAPRAEVIEVYVQNVLCESNGNGNTEDFTLGNNYNNWE